MVISNMTTNSEHTRKKAVVEHERMRCGAKIFIIYVYIYSGASKKNAEIKGKLVKNYMLIILLQAGTGILMIS